MNLAPFFASLRRMGTHHIEAPDGAFAELVLLPGDPLRARAIAERFFDDCRQVSGIRNMLAFTGAYRHRPVSVMGSGMGIPSLSIYVTELVRDYGVKRIVRVGTCGTVAADIAVGDLLLGIGAGTDSSVNRIRFGGYDLAATADFEMLERVHREARAREIPVRVGNIFSTDLFYAADPELTGLLEKFGFAGIEMEAAGLYGLALELKFKALTVATVSDHLIRGEALPAKARQQAPDQAVELVLDALLAD